MTLTEFLIARIAEDEAWASGQLSSPQLDVAPDWWTYMNQWHPVRVLAECAAKRRIVELHGAFRITPGSPLICDDCGDGSPCETLRLLALPYSDHDGYRAEWAPE